jgi:16S rRNA (uracil1498-N3)-methyltransferase
MDLVIQKATELGVTRIVPVLAGRSVVRIDPRQVERKRAHWQAVAVSACEQSGRSTLPAVELPVPLDAWLAVPPGDGPRLLLLPGAPLPLGSLTAGTAAATVLIGPEGGLTDAEQGAATAAGYEPRSLGPRILRTETAAIVALAVLQSSAGDLH